MDQENDGKIIDIRERHLQLFMKKRRPPEEIRNQLDIGYELENNCIELYEVRPRWDKKEERLKFYFARAKYIKSRNIWKVYWKRASGNWELYEPAEEVRELSEFLRIVDEDKYGCFWG